MNPDTLALLNAVLQLGVGERRVVRRKYFPPCTVHRYRDGWTVLHDCVSDRIPSPRALIGWHFSKCEDVADFLADQLGSRLRTFNLIGERPCL